MDEDEFSEEPKNKWQLRWGHIGLAIVIAGILIAVWVVYHRDRSVSNVQHGCTNSVTSKTCPSKSGVNKVSPAVGNKGVAANPKTSPSASAPTANGSKALSNVGPGNVVELFLITAIIGTVAYQGYVRYNLLRRND